MSGMGMSMSTLPSPAVTPDKISPSTTSPARPQSVSPTARAAAVDKMMPAGLDEASRPMEEDAVRKVLGLPPARRDSFTPDTGAVGAAEAPLGVWDEAGDRAADAGGAEGYLVGNAPLCLLLSNLGELFRWDAASAADLCADAFPGVRPW